MPRAVAVPRRRTGDFPQTPFEAMVKKLWAIGLGLVLVAGGLALRVSQVARRSARAGASAVAPLASSRAAVPLEVVEVAYDSALGNGWRDWGWGPHDLGGSGPAKINFSGYGGLMLHHAELHTSFGGVSFRYRAPDVWPEFMAVRLRGGRDAFPLVRVEPRHVAIDAEGWHEVLIGSGELNPNNLPIDGISIAAATSVPSEWVLIDKVVLTKRTGAFNAAQAPSRPTTLRIDCSAATKPINPMIYGVGAGDWESGASAQRLGGNPMTRLNWEAEVANAANDWFFENSKGGRVVDMVGGGDSHGAPTALVVPMIGWVAKDSTSVGFPRSKFPKQRKFDPNRPDAGDGFAPDGTPLKPGPPTQTSVAAPPEAIGRWVKNLEENNRARGGQGVAMYILDNEPSLWSTTHRDIHPDPLTYDELLDRTIRYATQIRGAAPQASIAGPAEWGWLGYLFSAKDQAEDATGRPDRRAHGDQPLIVWYLKALAEHERTTGKRLLDVLDLHFYPAAPGIYGADAKVDPAAADLRLRSTRALWDPSYRDESWINDTIRLIPRMKEWIAQYYPGLKTSIGEWSFGADEHISGALATAEALGRFGQQGLDSAFYWGGPRAGTGTFWAFRAFRNFDGKGGRFLDLSLPTQDAEGVSVFASRDSAGTHLVSVIVNRDANYASDTRLALEGCGRLVSRRVFGYGEGSGSIEPLATDAAQAPDARLTIPPYSIAIVELRLERH